MMARPTLGSLEVTLKATIRICREEDLPALEWMGLYTRHRHIIRAAFEAQERGDGLMLLAIASDFPIAQVWIDLAKKRAERTAIFWAIRTFHPLQSAGIGRRMLSAAECAACHAGYHCGELEVEHGNDAALRFYRRLGWQIVGRYGGRSRLAKELRALERAPALGPPAERLPKHQLWNKIPRKLL